MNHKPRFFLLFILIIHISCSDRKPSSLEISRGDVREKLLEYAKSNPEDEVIFETTYGTMKAKLYAETPLHRANFIKLVKDGVYEDAEFYRIFFQFMIQGGIYPKELPYTIPAEFNPKYIHRKGALSMARSDENNPNLESSSTEFFIVHGSPYADYQIDNEEDNNNLNLTDEQKKIYMTAGGYMSLDQQYTVFGEVTEGLEVIDRIASVKVFEQDKPLKQIPIRITLVSKK